MNKDTPEISIIMGSQSDWSVMIEASSLLEELGIAHETKIISAHRTPDRMAEFAKSAASNGIKVIIAGAGGAAHLISALLVLNSVHHLTGQNYDTSQPLYHPER